MDIKQAENTFDEMDGLTIKPRKGAESKHADKAVAQEGNHIDVLALIEQEQAEERTEVMSIRLTPSARKKIESIWLTQRQKRRKVKESTIAAEILMKVLENY